MMNSTPLCLLFLLILTLPRSGGGRVHDYETTRLKSTAGAGVGSILLNEAAILNPAPIAFFTNSSIYLQRESFEYIPPAGAQKAPKSDFDRSEAQGVIVADSKGSLHGALSYQKQREGIHQRRRFSVGLASTLTENSSFGVLFRDTKDERFFEGNIDGDEDEYRQLVFGNTYVFGPHFTVGAIVIDPFKKKREDTRAIVGVQYIVENILTFMFDVGTNYNSNMAETRLFRGAFQLNFFEDLFLRGGVFEDRALDEKGSGFGVAWVGPKLVFEVSFKSTKDLGLKENRADERAFKMEETSLAISYFF